MYGNAARLVVFEVTVDAWYVWIGVSFVAVGALAVVASLPSTAPPDAVDAARVVDGVASSGYAGTGEHPLGRATEIRLTSAGIGLRGGAGTAHANFRYGPVTPVRSDERLRRVLDGARPGTVFSGTRDLRRTARRARDRDPSWRPAPDALTVRRVTWRGVDVTLVG